MTGMLVGASCPGEGSEGASSDGGGGDALGLGYGSEGDDADGESPSAAAANKQEGNDVGKQEEQQSPSAALKQDAKEGDKQQRAIQGAVAAPLQEESSVAETGTKSIASEAAPDAAALEEDPDMPATNGSKHSMPSLVPAEAQDAAASSEDMAVGQPLEDTEAGALAEVHAAPASVSGPMGEEVPGPSPEVVSSGAGGDVTKPAFSKGDKCALFTLSSLQLYRLTVVES